MNGIAKAIGKTAGMLTGTAGFGSAVFGLAGAGVAYRVGSQMSSADQNVSRHKNTFSTNRFRDAGWGQRLSTIRSAGLAEGTHAFSGLGAMGSYGKARVGDTLASFNKAHVATGAAVGATLGGLAGMAGSIFSKNPVASKLILPLLGAGTVAGAYTARKVGLQIQSGVNTAKRNSLNRQKFTNRTRTFGSGFRTWANSGRMGKPGHLGMTGSMAFDLHKVRKRSTV
jgi:hypothetical protein